MVFDRVIVRDGFVPCRISVLPRVKDGELAYQVAINMGPLDDLDQAVKYAQDLVAVVLEMTMHGAPEGIQ